MRISQQAIAGAALLIVVALLAGATATTAAPSTGTTRQTFRAQFETMLSGLSRTAAQMQANPQIARNLAGTGTHLGPKITTAKRQVARMNSADLDRLRAAFEAHPGWQQLPNKVSQAVAAMKRASFARAVADGTPAPGTFTDDCSSQAVGDPYAEFIAQSVANQAQSVVQVLYMSVPSVIGVAPGGTVPSVAKQVLAVTQGVLNGIYLALAETLAVSVDCEGSQFSATQESTLPVDHATVVPASSELSIDALTNAAKDTGTELTTVTSTVTTIGRQSDSLKTAVGDANDRTGAHNLNATLNDDTDRVTDVQSGLQALQTSVDILINTQKTILDKADTEISNLSAAQTLQLRMAVEENLARNGNVGPIGLFELPAADGGYLEMVKSIVTETIAKEAANGNSTTQAARNLAAADAAFAGGQYKSAYKSYGQAYRFAQ